MYRDWALSSQQEELLIKAGDISAAIRAADDSDWEIDEELNFREPFDPFADDPE